MKWGLTATRRGLTLPQAEAIGLLWRGGSGEVHLGDCVGGDAQGWGIAVGIGTYYLVGHPPAKDEYRAYLEYHSEVLPTTYRLRNQAIVNACDRLVVAPSNGRRAGGTWNTRKYAEQVNKPHAIVWPNGTIRRYGDGWGHRA